MKKIIKGLLVCITILVSLASCDKNFDDLYQNNNKPSSTTPALNFTGILKDMYDEPASMNERWSQYFLINYDYYGNNRYDFGSGDTYYNSLINVLKMEQEEEKLGFDKLNPYSAIGKFFRAYFFTKMSLQMGDIPMKEALNGLDNLTPAYDSQKDVFKQSFVWLEEANADIASLIAKNDKTLAGDFYFNNNLASWQKVVNTFRLRLLIHLSKKESDADLDIKKQFSDIIGNSAKYPIMSSAADNLQFVYVSPTDYYPNNPGNFGYDALRYNTSATYVSLLTTLKDPRVFITAEPSDSLLKKGFDPTSYDAFLGANPGEDLGVMYKKTNNGVYSLLNRKHYYDSYTGEPSIQIGYSEMLFNIAEAINRGWIVSGPLGSAEAHYKEGIHVSMTYYGIPETGAWPVYFLHKGASLGTYDRFTVEVDFNDYYAQPLVQYSADGDEALTQILNQKYLSLFRHAGLESYYTYRRTGVPEFTTGAGTGNSKRIAMRFKYPGVERSANVINYKAALQNQFEGNDDINGMMWILK